MNELIQLQTALASIWSERDALLGDKVDEFETKLLPLLRALEADPLDADRLSAVYELLESYQAFYQRLLDRISAEGDHLRGGAVPQAAPALSTRPAVGRYVVVPVWYATDRKATGSGVPKEWYSGERGALTYGRVEVTIPDSHEKGKLEKPRLFRLEFREDPDKHVVLRAVHELELAAWTSAVKERLVGCGTRDILLFIHGYNVDFECAALRAAQFAYDLEFQGLCVLYSWPSEAATLKYTVDEDSAHWTVDHFEEVLLLLLTQVNAACVHAVAHSMGSRVLAEGLRRVDTASLPAGSASLREVVFAAPDINAETFRTFMTKFHTRANRFTLYASDSDKALECSQKLHKYPRAGDAGDGIVVTAGLETIDASAVDKTLLGHSYFCENRAVIQDLFNLIIKGQGSAAPRFGLKPRTTPDGTYWIMGL